MYTSIPHFQPAPDRLLRRPSQVRDYLIEEAYLPAAGKLPANPIIVALLTGEIDPNTSQPPPGRSLTIRQIMAFEVPPDGDHERGSLIEPGPQRQILHQALSSESEYEGIAAVMDKHKRKGGER